MARKMRFRNGSVKKASRKKNWEERLLEQLRKQREQLRELSRTQDRILRWIGSSTISLGVSYDIHSHSLDYHGRPVRSCCGTEL